MEYILLIVFWVSAQGWSVGTAKKILLHLTAEFGDQAACEAARVVARDAFNETYTKKPGGDMTGQTHCLPKHSPKP